MLKIKTMDREKLIKELFTGKVSEIIGFKKTTELLKESTIAIDEMLKNKTTTPKEKVIELFCQLRNYSINEGKFIDKTYQTVSDYVDKMLLHFESESFGENKKEIDFWNQVKFELMLITNYPPPSSTEA